MEVQKFIADNKDEMLETLKELCYIPAPAHLEHKRAEHCKKWLEKNGAKDVYIDDALNVIFPLGCEKSNEITVFAAHTDTVFPDTEPMPYYDDGEKIHCPGCADDTAAVAVLLMMAKFFVEKKVVPEKGIMFVCNSCEEGLGNLKGTRQLFKDYDGRIARFITFDSVLNIANDRCVGSHRFEIEVLTRGGHSYGDFGNENAIAVLSKVIAEIYKTQVPDKPGTKTTYNVGLIDGGTSVNTIAQSAKMLCEYRSDDKECLEIMKKRFEEIFDSVRSENVQVKVANVGERPCGDVDEQEIESLKQIVTPLIEEVTGRPLEYKSSSTDCNIPLSLGIPAICIGVCDYEGMHTREEWVEKKSLEKGLEIAIKLAYRLT